MERGCGLVRGSQPWSLVGPRAVSSLWVGEREVEKGLSHGKACKQEPTGPRLCSSLTACQGSCLDLWRTSAPAIKCQSGKLASTQSPRGITTSSPHEKKRLRLISSFMGWDPDSEGPWRSPGPVANRCSHPVPARVWNAGSRTKPTLC